MVGSEAMAPLRGVVVVVATIVSWSACTPPPSGFRCDDDADCATGYACSSVGECIERLGGEGARDELAHLEHL